MKSALETISTPLFNFSRFRCFNPLRFLSIQKITIDNLCKPFHDITIIRFSTFDFEILKCWIRKWNFAKTCIS